MKNLIIAFLFALVLPVLALAQSNAVWDEARVPATSMTTYGNVTGTAQALRIWPVATSGGGSFVFPIPADICQAQPIEPRLYYSQNGTQANKTAVTFVMSYQVLRAGGHNQATYTSTVFKNATSGALLNSTVQSVQFAQITPDQVSSGGAIAVSVYRKGQATSDTAGNATIPIGMFMQFKRCPRR